MGQVRSDQQCYDTFEGRYIEQQEANKRGSELMKKIIEHRKEIDKAYDDAYKKIISVIKQ